LSVLPFTTSDYPFDIFKLFLRTHYRYSFLQIYWCPRGHDSMVDGFTTARVIKRLSPLTLSVRAALVAKVLDTTLNIKFVSDLRQVGSFLILYSDWV